MIASGNEGVDVPGMDGTEGAVVEDHHRRASGAVEAPIAEYVEQEAPFWPLQFIDRQRLHNLLLPFALHHLSFLNSKSTTLKKYKKRMLLTRIS